LISRLSSLLNLLEQFLTALQKNQLQKYHLFFFKIKYKIKRFKKLSAIKKQKNQEAPDNE